MAQPDLMWEPFEIEAGRTVDYKFKLYKSDKKAAALDAEDVVRFKLSLGADDDEPLLDVRSGIGGATANGSSVTVSTLGVEDATPAIVIVRFAQADTIDYTIRREDYFGEIGVVDNSETAPADAFKRAGYGPVTVKPSPGGNVGLSD